MRPRNINLCDCMEERLSAQVDKLTGKEAREALYDQIDRVTNRDIQDELYITVHRFALEQINAAFKLGLQAATNPALWLFETHER